MSALANQKTRLQKHPAGVKTALALRRVLKKMMLAPQRGDTVTKLKDMGFPGEIGGANQKALVFTVFLRFKARFFSNSGSVQTFTEFFACDLQQAAFLIIHPPQLPYPNAAQELRVDFSLDFACK